MIEKFGHSNENHLSHEAISAMTKKAAAVNGEHSLNMEQFIDAFGIDKVKGDYAKVANRISGHLERKMSDVEKLGHIFEAAFLDQATKHSWFGKKSEVTKASKFDDIMNGIDMVTTLLDKNDIARHFEVASDLTISRTEAENKFNRITRNIKDGELATINYFHSDLIGYTGRLVDVPRTVITLDTHNLNRFLTNWLREPEMEQEMMAKLMISQIGTQAAGFANFAQNIHGSDSRIYRRYKSTYDASKNLLETGTMYDLPDDKATESIAEMSARVAKMK